MTSDLFPFNEIRKRDGRIVPFDAEKLPAIFKAAWAVDEDYLLPATTKRLAHSGKVAQFDSFSRRIECSKKILIERGHARTAAYCQTKRTFREAKSELMDVVKEILMKAAKRRGKTFHLQKMHALLWLQQSIIWTTCSAGIAGAHRRGFHIHNLGYYSKTLDSYK